MTEHQATIWLEEMQMKHTVSHKAKPSGAQLIVWIGATYYRVTTTVRVDLRLIDLVRQMQARLAEAGVTA